MSQVQAVTKEGMSPLKTAKEIALRDELFTAREFGLSFSNKEKQAAQMLQSQPTISYISVYPRGQLY